MQVKINGWVGKWDPDRRYVFSPIAVTADSKKIILVDNPRGNELRPYMDGNEKSQQKSIKYDPIKNDYVTDTFDDRTIPLLSRTIDRDGPRFCAVIIGVPKLEIELTKDEYIRLDNILIAQSER